MQEREHDLFGQKREFISASPKAKKNGYAGTPGLGPEGETCGSCDNFVRVMRCKTYFKCFVIKSRWTHGTGTDIKMRSSACEQWDEVRNRL